MKNRCSNAVGAALPACRQAGAGRPLTKGFPNSGAPAYRTGRHRGAKELKINFKIFLGRGGSLWPPNQNGSPRRGSPTGNGGNYFLQNDKGISALFLVIAMLLMITIGYVFSYLIPTKQKSVLFPIQSNQAYFIAQSGVEFAVRYAKDQGWTTPTQLLGLNGGAVYQRNLGAGRVTINYNNTTDTLTSSGEVPIGTERRRIVVSNFTSFLYYFTYRKSIAVKSTGQVSGGPHTNFPMLVSVTDANLATVANNGHIASYNVATNDPWDLVFMGLDDNTCNVAGGGTNPCRLSHQIETYNSSTGQLIAWVKVPKMYYTSSSDRTVIYMYYGNSCMTASTQNASGVWNSNYVGVWHLKETDIDGGSGDIKDSTGNANNGTTSGMDASDQVAGKIDGSFDFDGTNDQVIVNDNSTLNIRSTLTMETWVNASAYNAKWNDAMGKGQYDWYTNKGKVCAYFVTNAGTYDACPGTYTMVTGTWYHIAVTYNAGSIKTYVNGAQDGTASKGTTINDSTGNNFLIAYTSLGGPIFWQGKQDEVRVSNIARSADWIATEYNNQSAPSSFYTEGAEEN